MRKRTVCLCLDQVAAVAPAKADVMELAPTFANELQRPDLPLGDPSWCVQDFIKVHVDKGSTRGSHPYTNFKDEQTTTEKLSLGAAKHIKLIFKEELTTLKKLDPKATEFTPLHRCSSITILAIYKH